MTAEDDTPDWQRWLSMPSVTLFEATALSMSIEPRWLRPHVPGYRDAGIAVVGIPPPGFNDRLALAQRCLGDTLPGPVNRLACGEALVRLRDFAAWTGSVGWDLPAELQRLFAGDRKPVSRPPSREKPFWADAHEEAQKWLIENGCPARGDGNQAALERHVAEWLENHGFEVGESTIRRRVRLWINERREALG